MNVKRNVDLKINPVPGDVIYINEEYYLFATLEENKFQLVSLSGSGCWDIRGTENSIVEQIQSATSGYDVTIYSKNQFAFDIIKR